MNTSNRIPINVLSNRHQDVLAMTHYGPVTLIEEEEIAGVLLSPAQWDAIKRTLRAAQEYLAAADAKEQEQEHKH